MIKTTFRRSLHGTLALAVAIALTGCAVGPDYKRPQVSSQGQSYSPTPMASDTASVAGPGGEAQHVLASMDIPGQWWTLFHSEPLNGLIDDALRHNADIEAAHASLQAAWESVYAQRGAYFPRSTRARIPRVRTLPTTWPAAWHRTLICTR